MDGHPHPTDMVTPTSSTSGSHEPPLDPARARVLVRFLEELFDSIAVESQRDFPRPGHVLAQVTAPGSPDTGRLEEYLRELLRRLIASQVVLYGRAVHSWSERTRARLDPEAALQAADGPFVVFRKARAFDALRQQIVELRPSIVEQEIDAEFKRLHGQRRRPAPPTP